MNLKDDKQQNIQMQLDFSLALTGEAREAGREGTEASGAMNGTENPASTNRLMEEVCERENLKAALQRVKANQGSPGVDGMTVIGIKDYLKQRWPAIREQLLSGTYEPKPVRRVEIAKPDGGVRKLGMNSLADLGCEPSHERTRTHGRRFWGSCLPCSLWKACGHRDNCSVFKWLRGPPLCCVTSASSSISAGG
jgi:hypothetical protein